MLGYVSVHRKHSHRSVSSQKASLPVPISRRRSQSTGARSAALSKAAKAHARDAKPVGGFALPSAGAAAALAAAAVSGVRSLRAVSDQPGAKPIPPRPARPPRSQPAPTPPSSSSASSSSGSAASRPPVPVGSLAIPKHPQANQAPADIENKYDVRAGHDTSALHSVSAHKAVASPQRGLQPAEPEPEDEEDNSTAVGDPSPPPPSHPSAGNAKAKHSNRPPPLPPGARPPPPAGPPPAASHRAHGSPPPPRPPHRPDRRPSLHAFNAVRPMAEESPEEQEMPVRSPNAEDEEDIEYPPEMPEEQKAHVRQHSRAMEKKVQQQPWQSKFATKLIHKWPHVAEQVQTGLYGFKRLRGFFKRYHALQTDFSKQMRKLVDEEMHKIESFTAKTPDRMSSTHLTWIAVLDGMREIAASHAHYATELTMGMFHPLDTVHGIGSERVKGLMKSLEKSKDAVAAADKALGKRKVKCNNLLQDMDDAAVKLQHKKKSGNIGPAQAEKAERNVEKLRQKALEECVRYDLQRREVSQQRESHYLRELPEALGQMELLEQIRVHHTKVHLTSFLQMQSNFHTRLNDISDRLKGIVSDLKPSEDIDYFIRHCNAVHGDPPVWKPYEYDLRIPLTQLRPGYINANVASFGTTIEEMIRAQKRSDPTKDFDGVPRVLFALGKAVAEKGGYEEEGIFRVSPSKKEMAELREQFCYGNFATPFASPHTYAGLLKFWLRDLAEPLIPFELYDEAVALGKVLPGASNDSFSQSRAFGGGKANARAPPPLPEVEPDSPGSPGAAEEKVLLLSPKGDPGSSGGRVAMLQRYNDPEQTRRQLVRDLSALLSKVPACNRRVINYIITMIRSIAAREHINRMSVANLAIVFAPSFLRHKSDDPMIMFRDAKYAAQLVVHLTELSSEPEPGADNADDSIKLDLLGKQPFPVGRLSIGGIPVVSLKEAQRRVASDVQVRPPGAPSEPAKKKSKNKKKSGQPSKGILGRFSKPRQVSAQYKGNAADAKSHDSAQWAQIPEEEVSVSAAGPASPVPPPELPRNWVQYYSDDGTPYYLNVITNESRWEPPPPPNL